MISTPCGRDFHQRKIIKQDLLPFKCSSIDNMLVNREDSSTDYVQQCEVLFDVLMSVNRC